MSTRKARPTTPSRRRERTLVHTPRWHASVSRTQGVRQEKWGTPSDRLIQTLTVTFFFSSRRRHTRWTGDWSSDVCSSDLKKHHLNGNEIDAWIQRGDELYADGRYAEAVSCFDRAIEIDALCADAWCLRGDKIGRASCRERVWGMVGAGAVRGERR